MNKYRFQNQLIEDRHHFCNFSARFDSICLHEKFWRAKRRSKRHLMQKQAVFSSKKSALRSATIFCSLAFAVFWTRCIILQFTWAFFSDAKTHRNWLNGRRISKTLHEVIHLKLNLCTWRCFFSILQTWADFRQFNFNKWRSVKALKM